MARPQEKRWSDPLAALAQSRRAVARAFAGLLRQAGAIPAAPGLEEADLPHLQRQIEECLNARGGAASARARAAALGRSYLALDSEGRERFLRCLAHNFGPDVRALQAAAENLATAAPAEFAAARRKLARAMEAPRLRLLRQFNGIEQGVKFLVDLRADLLAMKGEDPELGALESELFDLLASWFDIGFLELKRITWDAPAALLEKLVDYEAVHEIRSWEDLKNRLDSDRRCYAFFHPAMPGEPLIFVEVALVDGLASRVQALLDEEAPATNPAKADTAIFYSISNAQKGLQGVGFGDFLIKQVVDRLTHDLPNLKQFATLSPIPGFRRWLEREQNPLSPEERAVLGPLAGQTDGKAALLALLDRPDWHKDATLSAALEPVLMRLGAAYLLSEKRQNGEGVPRALDPVEHFHLSNGARVERLNWLADTSKNGLSQSAGLMVNYLYRRSDIEGNHERYRAEGRIAASNKVAALEH